LPTILLAVVFVIALVLLLWWVAKF
jgi:hypothetical protein